jgi:hypothetical protein
LAKDDMEWRMPVKAVPMARAAPATAICRVGYDAGGGVGGRGGPAGDSAVMTGCTRVGSGGDKGAGSGGGRSARAESPSIGAGSLARPAEMASGGPERWATIVVLRPCRFHVAAQPRICA